MWGRSTCDLYCWGCPSSWWGGRGSFSGGSWRDLSGSCNLNWNLFWLVGKHYRMSFWNNWSLSLLCLTRFSFYRLLGGLFGSWMWWGWLTGLIDAWLKGERNLTKKLKILCLLWASIRWRLRKLRISQQRRGLRWGRRSSTPNKFKNQLTKQSKMKKMRRKTRLETRRWLNRIQLSRKAEQRRFKHLLRGKRECHAWVWPIREDYRWPMFQDFQPNLSSSPQKRPTSSK